MNPVKNISWSIFVLSLGFMIPLLGFILTGSFLQFQKNSLMVYSANQANLATVVKRVPINISIVFVGDIMLDRMVESSVFKNANGDFSFLFEKVSFIKNADIAFANLEGPVSNKGGEIGNLYSFRFLPESLGALMASGLDVFSIANNHVGDWGKEAFEDTIFRLNDKYLYAIGGGMNKEEATQVKIFKWPNASFGFLGFSDVGPAWMEATQDGSGILLVKEKEFVGSIKKAARQVDVLVVSIHFGEEYQTKANERQRYLARLAIDNGAKVVVGHHPHVVQEVEVYGDGVIAYSLGNFIFDQNFSEETMEGLALQVYFEDDEIITIKKHKIKINEFFQPELVE